MLQPARGSTGACWWARVAVVIKGNIPKHTPGLKKGEMMGVPATEGFYRADVVLPHVKKFLTEVRLEA